MKQINTMLGLILILVCGPIYSMAGNTRPTGMDDIDTIRKEVIVAATHARNENSRRSALLRWWRFMWRRGQDMSAFDAVAEALLDNAPGSEANRAAIDRGYAVLEEMWEDPLFIPEKTLKQRDRSGSTTDWPYYMGPTRHNTGYSPDPGPSEGRLAWRFPKGNKWDVVPVVEQGKIYLSSPGIDVVGFCLDESTGKVIWRARQFGERFYVAPTSKADPEISADRMLVRVGSQSRMRIFDKETGQPVSRRDSGIPARDSVFSYKYSETIVVLADARTGREIWTYDAKSPLSGEPQIDSGSVYAATESGVVCRIGVAASNPVWRVDLGTSIRGKLSVGKNSIYIGGRNPVMFALNKADGSVLWKYETDRPEPGAYQYFSPVLEVGKHLYFGTASREVHCLDAKDGSLIWKHEVGDWVRARPAKVEETVYVATLGSRLYALKESASGVVEDWIQPLGVHGITADLVAGEEALLASGRDFIMYSVDYDTGQVRWRHGILDGAWIDGEFIHADYTSSLPGSPTVADGVVYIGGPDGFVNALDVETGNELWRLEVGGGVSAAVSLIDGKAMFGEIGNQSADLDKPDGQYDREEGPQYFAVDQGTGKPVWTSRELGKVWIGAIDGSGVMFVGDMRGWVYGVDPDTGKKLWQYYTAADTPQENKPDDHYRHGWPPGVYCSPVADEECFYTGSWSGYYFAFEHKSGKLRWRTQTGFPETGGGLPDSAAPTLHKNHLYIQKQGTIIAAINIHSGKIAWEWKAPPWYLQNGTLAALGDNVYGSAARRATHIPFSSRIYCFSDVESGGEVLWSHRDGGGLTAPVVTDKQLVFGSSTGMFLTSLDPETGALRWRLFTGGEMTENVPAIYGDMVFSVSENGWLNAVK